MLIKKSVFNVLWTSTLMVVVAAMLAAPLMGCLFGAFSGWVVSFVYEAQMLRFFEGLGITGLSPSEIGAMLGFVGSFFKGSCKTKSCKAEEEK